MMSIHLTEEQRIDLRGILQFYVGSMTGRDPNRCERAKTLLEAIPAGYENHKMPEACVHIESRLNTLKGPAWEEAIDQQLERIEAKLSARALRVLVRRHNDTCPFGEVPLTWKPGDLA